jgi:hypothetical protein
MEKQRGLALSGLILWGIIISLLAVFSMKVVPTVLEYMKIAKDSKAVVAQLGPTATVQEVKESFKKFIEIDQLTITPDQLDISKTGSHVVISFAYEKRIPLFANVSLVIDYQGSTAAP